MTSAAQELATDGATIYRALLSADHAETLRGTVNDIYAHLNSCADFKNRLFGESFRQWNGVWLAPLPSFLRETRPDLATRYDASIRMIEAQVNFILGRGWRFFPKRSFFRRHIGTATKVAWHIDADAAAIFKIAASVVNVWMPLDHVGGELPSLDFMPRSHLKMRKLPMLTGADRHRSDSFAATFGGATTPQLRPGDALIFDQFLLHRTQNIAATNATRTACEFRFVTRSLPTLRGTSGWLRYANNAIASKAKTLLKS